MALHRIMQIFQRSDPAPKAFVGCTRCGGFHHNTCPELREFLKVTTPFLYDGQWATIWQEAKRGNGFRQQFQCERFIDNLIFPDLLSVIKTQKIRWAVIAGFSRQRVQNPEDWHPLFYITERLLECSPGVTPLLGFKQHQQKMSALNAKQRLRILDGFYSNNEEENTFWKPDKVSENLIEKHNFTNQNILLLDDVITTGTTARLTMAHCATKLKKGNWYLYGCLRTPKTSLWLEEEPLETESELKWLGN